MYQQREPASQTVHKHTVPCIVTVYRTVQTQLCMYVHVYVRMYVHVKAQHQTTAVQSLEQIHVAEVRTSGGYH